MTAPDPVADLPAANLPAADLPAADLPAKNLPAKNLPATDLPATDLPDEAAASTALVGRSVRQQLGIFTIALVTPILIFTGLLFWQNAVAERAGVEGDAKDAARGAALAIDRELTGLFASIDVLSTSRSLQSGDYEALHRQAKVLEERQGITTLLTDRTGQQLVNSRLPWGTTLPKTNVPLDSAALDKGRPFVTDLYHGAVSGAPLFAVVTGVTRVAAPMTLVFALDMSRLQAILAQTDLPAGAVVSIVDRHGIIMARSQRAAEFVGREATQDLRDHTTGREGTWSGTTVDGTPVFGTYSRSRLSDFRVAVGISYAALNEPLWRLVGLFAALGAGIVALSLALGLFFGKRITGPIKTLSARAVALGRGEPVLPLATTLYEANVVGAELAAASELRLARETELSDANDEIQRFAYIVSHDLRSPLVNIMGFTTELEALREDVFGRLTSLRGTAADPGVLGTDRQLGEDFDEAIGFIKASIEKMDRLINAILRLSRAGRREFKGETVDMNALVAGIRASLAHQADEAGATITVGSLPELESDRLGLEQIFSNLIDNAVKYLNKGVPGQVEVTGRAAGSRVLFEVRDNGRGIDPRDRERVFELFRRSGVQDRPGEGIGLAHVRALVRRLGGKISLTSAPGQGSTFTIILPRRWSGEAQRKAA